MAAAPAVKETPDETRERILTVADDLFRTLGYGKTTVADIARDSGMSPANVYRFFDSKSDVVGEIAVRWLSETDDRLRTIAKGPGSAADRLRQVIIARHEEMRDRYTHEQRVHELCALVIKEHWPVVERHIAHFTGTIEVILRDGIATGEFRDMDAATTARLIKTAVIKFCHPILIAEFYGEDLVDQANGIIDLMIRALSPD